MTVIQVCRRIPPSANSALLRGHYIKKSFYDSYKLEACVT